MHLDSTDPGATEYASGQLYALNSFHGGLTAHLGSSWYTELTRDAAGDRIEVGPVSPTAPELAVSMTIHVHNAQFTRVVARTASGHEYTFSATPTPDK